MVALFLVTGSGTVQAAQVEIYARHNLLSIGEPGSVQSARQTGDGFYYDMNNPILSGWKTSGAEHRFGQIEENESNDNSGQGVVTSTTHGALSTDFPEAAEFLPTSQQKVANYKDIMEKLTAGNVALVKITEDSIGWMQRLNSAWNTLDQRVAREVLRGLGYLGLPETFAEDSNESRRLALASLQENLNGDGHAESGYYESAGFFGFILKIPSLLTFHNFVVLSGILILSNGLYRALRFILLRL